MESMDEQKAYSLVVNPFKSDSKEFYYKPPKYIEGIIDQDKLRKYEYEYEPDCIKSTKEEKKSKNVFTVSPLWANHCVKSEPSDVESKDELLAENLDTVSPLGGNTKVKSEPPDFQFEDEEIGDDLDTVSPLWGENISVKSEPPGVEFEDGMITLSGHSENEYDYNKAEYLKTYIKPDPTYRANLYTGDVEKYIENEYIHSNISSNDNIYEIDDSKNTENYSYFTNKKDTSTSDNNNNNISDDKLSKFDYKLNIKDTNQVKSYLESGILYLEEKQLLEVVNQYPDNTNILLSLATSHFRIGNNNTALKYLNLVLILQPKNLCAIINKGSIFASEGNLLAALELFENAIKDNPKNTTAKEYYYKTLKEMAQRLTDEGYYSEAIKHYQKCIYINPYDKECEEALSKIEYKRFASETNVLTALDMFENVVNDNPENTAAKEYYYKTLKEIAKRLTEEGYYSEAIGNYQKCIYINPYDKECEEALSKLRCKSQEMLPKVKTIKSIENVNNYTYDGSTFIHPKVIKEEELVYTPSIKIESDDEDMITTTSDMLKELNDSLIIDNSTFNIRNCENFTCKISGYEILNNNTRECKVVTQPSTFTGQNDNHTRIRMAIIGDSHALHYPCHLFSEQFFPYLLKYQPFILNLHRNKSMDKMLITHTKPEAAIIIMGGNDVARTLNKDHHILQALIQTAENLHRHNIQPIIVPILHRRTEVNIPPNPAAYNVRAHKINNELQETLYRKLKFNPVVDFMSNTPELMCDGVHLTKADYENLTNKIIHHYIKTKYDFCMGNIL